MNPFDQSNAERIASLTRYIEGVRSSLRTCLRYAARARKQLPNRSRDARLGALYHMLGHRYDRRSARAMLASRLASKD